MSIRLLACDIDDTLVRFPDPPSERVVRALRAAIDAGVTVALVTGRAFPRARPIAQSLGITAPLICNHGGSIRHLDGSLIHAESVPRPLMAEIVGWLQMQNVVMMLFDVGKGCVDGDASVPAIYHDCTAGQVVPDFHPYTDGPGTRFVCDLRAYIPEQTETLLVSSLDHDHLAGVYERACVKFDDRARMLFTHPYGLDILAQTATKSQSLAWLAGQVGAAQDEVMAIGDGVNDIDMLVWAGIGVAMGNARPETKAVADVIAPSFEADGVAWAVERFVLRIDR
ncbi:MAG: HAD family phosphatase [Anaerolineae bacterium]|nr:HAD family phosphatase [Anaerolineae bacterium]